MSEKEMSKCESESLDKPEVKCALSGEYEPMRCISVMSSSIWNISTSLSKKLKCQFYEKKTIINLWQ